jgi:DNA processing protein
MVVSNAEVWLKVYHAFYYSIRNLLALLKKYPIEQIPRLPSNILKRYRCSDDLIKRLRHPDANMIDATLKWLQAGNHHLLTLDSVNYPSILNHIYDPPPLLFIAGDPSLLNRDQLAVVGSRSASRGAMDVALEWSHDLSQHLLITSGLAIGVDGAAHRGALQAGQPTIAVLGGGIDNIYPRRHQALAQQVVENGALVSEFPLHTGPLAYHFPRRNRIISGLSLATLIIEARLRSGSLITAEFALEQGREVLVVPGSVLNPLAEGGNKLIQLGAQIVTSTTDILQSLPDYQSLIALDKAASNQTSSLKSLDLEARRLLECVGFEPTGMDVILSRCQFSIQKAASELLELELAGYIHKEALGYTRVK